MHRAICLSTLFGLLFVASVFPQGGESTQILGIAEDTTGSVVPGVTITRGLHVATGQLRQVITGESGNYVFTNLVPASTSCVRKRRVSRPKCAAV